MAIKNFTAEKDRPWYENRYCSVDVSGSIHFQLTCFSVVNIFLSVSALLGNSMILVSLQKVFCFHPPSKVLLRCLAITDLCVGMIAQPLFVTYLLSAVNEHWDTCQYASAAITVAGYTLSGVSLLTLTAITTDRLLALLLGLRYRQVVTLKRTYLIVTIFCLVSFFVGATYFWNSVLTLWASSTTALLCLVLSGTFYSKIFLALRHHRTQVEQTARQSSLTIPQNVVKYRKTLSGIIWVQLTLTVCYIPYVVWAIFFLKDEKLSPSVVLSKYFSLTLVFLNSTLNPFLYCWKLRDVRQAVKETIRQNFCC